MSEIQKQCIFAQHLPSRKNRSEDMLLVKERIKDETGREYPNVRLIKNYKRSYWVTKQGKRNHKQKRDYELLENLDEYSCTQANLANHAFKTLNGYHSQNGASLSQVAMSPYLYGADIPSTSIIKESYMSKYPDFMARASMGVMDFETDVVNGKGEDIIIGIFTMESNIYIGVTEEFIGTLPNPEELFKASSNKVIGLFLKQLNDTVIDGNGGKNAKWGKPLMDIVNSKILNLDKLNIQFKICSNEYTVAEYCMEAAKELLPDFLVFWNMGADIGFIENACRKHNKSIAKLFAYKEVPPEFHYYNERWKDELVKKKANGETMSKDFIDLWHKVRTAAPFQVVCAMAFYHLNRKMSIGKLNSYSLEAILQRELGLGKLYGMVDCGHIIGSYSWHREMQKKYKLEYMLYAIFDGIMVEVLEAKTNDIGISLQTYLNVSDLSKASSNPRRNADSDHFFYLKHGKVITSTSKNMSTELDHMTLSVKDIIITLPAERVTKTGRSFVHGISNDRSRWSFHAGDIDLASSYPTTTVILNASPGTTRIETCKIGNLTDSEIKSVALDLTASKVNAVALSRKIYKVPNLEEALDYF